MIAQVEQILTKHELFGFIIEKTAKEMKLAFGRILSKNNLGITVDQWVVLNILKHEDGISQLELADKASKDAPTITRILDLLQKKELIERTSDPSDRRKFLIHLTGSGVSKVQEVLPIARKFREVAYEGMSIEDLEQLRIIMKNIYSNLQKD